MPNVIPNPTLNRITPENLTEPAPTDRSPLTQIQSPRRKASTSPCCRFQLLVLRTKLPTNLMDPEQNPRITRCQKLNPKPVNKLKPRTSCSKPPLNPDRTLLIKPSFLRNRFRTRNPASTSKSPYSCNLTSYIIGCN